MNHKAIVLDDDPTGTQTVHDIYVYTDWQKQTLARAVLDGKQASYILTNSRSLPREETIRLHRRIAQDLAEVERETGRRLLIISRSDSTLRGHFPDETEALRDGLPYPVDGEVIIPFFPEGGRITRDNTHYVRMHGEYVPVHETEFARDVSFGFTHSHLGQWVEEKTGGRYRAAGCLYVPLGQDEEKTYRELMRTCGFAKVIVNAVTYQDLQTFTRAVLRAIDGGKQFLFRTAAAFPKVIAGCGDRPLLGANSIRSGKGRGTLLIVGSHVRNTSEQLAHLRQNHPQARFLEFSAQAALRHGGLDAEADRILCHVEDILAADETAVVYTSRRLLQPAGADADGALRMSTQISGALTGIVARLSVRPAYLLAKGGITSSDVAVKGLGIQRALVLGQILDGVPVWRAGEESRFPGLSYIVFPGNVGTPDSLSHIVKLLARETSGA